MNIDKLLSGRFLLTIICGIVYCVMSVNGLLPPDKAYDVILVVFYAYFTKDRNNKK